MKKIFVFLIAICNADLFAMSEPYHSPIIDSLKKIAERTFSGDKIPPSKVHAAHIIENHFSKQKYENNGSSSSEKKNKTFKRLFFCKNS